MAPTPVWPMRAKVSDKLSQHSSSPGQRDQAASVAWPYTGDHVKQNNQDAPSRLLAAGSENRSVRERFNVNTQTGGVSFTIPIQASPGRSGVGPSLSLLYNSGSASTNSAFGLGWRLSGVDSITRKTSTMVPIYDDDKDTFVHSSIGDLVPMLQSNDENPVEWEDKLDDTHYQVRMYRPRVEIDPIRVQRWSSLDGSGKVYWKTISPGNVTTIFGYDNSSQITSYRSHCNSQGPLLVFSWLASEIYDNSGNHMVFSYKGESRDVLEESLIDRLHEKGRNMTSQRYLKSIKYGNKTPHRDLEDWNVLLPVPQDDPWYWMFELIFDYGEYPHDFPMTNEGPFVWNLRPDPFSVHSSGFEIRTYRRCERVLMFHHFEELKRLDCLIAATEFKYEIDAKSGVSVLQSATQCGYQLDHPKETYSCIRLPPIVFEYWAAPDPEEVLTESLDLNVAGLSSPLAQWVDLDGDGAPGVLSHALGGWYYHRNESKAKLDIVTPSLVSHVPSVIVSDSWSFEDLTGDGKLDLTFATHDGGISGFYEKMDDGKWSNFVPFGSYPTAYSLKDSSIYKVDLNGNGYADLLQVANQDDNELSWYPSLGRQGYGIKKCTTGVPALPFGETRYTLLCDMDGDGLSDIVIIDNGHICYWSNMGHGRFGSKVMMSNSPFVDDIINFTPLRLRMADITGSGTADLIYLPPEGGLRIYYNQSGNNWSEAHTLSSFPCLDHFCAVDVFDIGGRGTQCLVWTSDHYSNDGGSTSVQFLDLMGGYKPGILTKCSNSIGGEVEIAYRSSTQYRLDDKFSGRPWPTKLPFPIECVKSVITRDHIAQTSCTMRYAYHNGYYDAVEREFRGFQMVEEWDAEDFTVDAVSQRFHRPPVHTKTWFYIGLQRIDEAVILPESYQTNQSQQDPLPASIFTAKATASQLSTVALQDAYRALSGAQRRQEVYSDDGSQKSSIPYTIAQKTYDVVIHQGADQAQRCGIFRVNGREEITSHYERDPNEAKIQHSFILEVDYYGNICQQAVVSYGKLESKLKDGDEQRQKETFINYTVTNYTNAIDPLGSCSPMGSDYFQASLPSEVSQYRILPGSEWVRQSPHRYEWATLATSFSDAVEVPHHEEFMQCDASIFKGSKILISRTRILYTSALDEPLPIHKVERFAIKYQTYQLVFTRDILETGLQLEESPLISYDEIKKELSVGGYVQLDNTCDEWWASSPRELYLSCNEGRSPNSSIAIAHSHFYIPNATLDQYGNTSHYHIDRYKLLPVKTIDAMKNEISFTNDYASLNPFLVTDANGNRTQTAFDPCGRLVAVAVMGKETEEVGDSFDGFSVNISQELLNQFIIDPSGSAAAQLLQKAGRRTIYHDRFELNANGVRDKIAPSFRAELVRHTHTNPQHPTDSPSQISVHITYLDGHGGTVQEVVLSENTSDKTKWQFSGGVIRDNKNQPVKHFLPFTAASHNFRQQGDSHPATATILLRDPLDRVVGMLNADHTWSKTRFTPWMQVDFDAGDTVGIDDPETDEDIGSYFCTLSRDSYIPSWYNNESTSQNAALKSTVYHDTPKTTHTDSLGRHIVTEVVNRLQDKAVERRLSKQDYDIRGNASQLRDAMDRVVMKSKYDLLGRLLFNISMDGGSRWELYDCNNALLLSCSSRDIQQRYTYDQLRRIEKVKVLQPCSSSSEKVAVKYVYGESSTNAKHNNLRGQLHHCYDQSGLQTNVKFDFNGRCCESSVKYAVEYREILDWEGESEPKLEAVKYKTKLSFNAIGQLVDSQDFSGNKVYREYDVAGRLKTLKSRTADEKKVTSSIENLEYSEEGKILQIAYGNGSSTTHEYDKATRRLTKTWTKGQDGAIVEDVSYTYDCLGKVVQKTNTSQQAVFFNNAIVLPVQDFTYDALGQLIRATGREQIGISKQGQKCLRPFDAASKYPRRPSRSEPELVQYLEKYQYDVVGNILQLQHDHYVGDGGTRYAGWTRNYTYEEPSCIDKESTSNRLTKTAIGKTEELYGYAGDGGQNGCITSIPGYSVLGWDHNDKLRAFSTQRVNRDTATPEVTWYVYNAQGERVRKVTDRCKSQHIDDSTLPQKSKETRYLPLQDAFIRYEGDGTKVSFSITTTNVGDRGIGSTPIALLELDSRKEKALVVRYQISENIELDDNGQLISYEEYSPYGASTYQADVTGVPRKYRFMKYQRDCESGLDICGERYYCPWLGRWLSPDPIGTTDGPNLYRYVGNDPVNFDDHLGTARKAKHVGLRSSRENMSGVGKRMQSYLNITSKYRKDTPLVTVHQDSEGGNAGENTRTQVTLPIGLIRFSQSAVSPNIHNPGLAGQMTDIRDEMKSLKHRVQELQRGVRGDNGTRGPKLRLAEAERRATAEFLGRFGQISVTLASGQGNPSSPQTNGWYTLDNRRLTILRGALSKRAEITARVASQEEYFGMVKLDVKLRETYEKIITQGTDRNWDPISQEALKKFFAPLKGKWSTTNNGDSIRISRGNSR